MGSLSLCNIFLRKQTIGHYSRHLDSLNRQSLCRGCSRLLLLRCNSTAKHEPEKKPEPNTGTELDIKRKNPYADMTFGEKGMFYVIF